MPFGATAACDGGSDALSAVGAGARARRARARGQRWRAARPAAMRVRADARRLARAASCRRPAPARAIAIGASTASWRCPTRPRATTRTTCTARARSSIPRPSTGTTRDWRGRPWHEAVIYELHVGTFTPEGTLRRRRRAAAAAGGARHHRDRADAARRLPRHAQLGLRRRAAVRAGRRLRHARGPEAPRRRRARAWA